MSTNPENFKQLNKTAFTIIKLHLEKSVAEKLMTKNNCSFFLTKNNTLLSLKCLYHL